LVFYDVCQKESINFWWTTKRPGRHLHGSEPSWAGSSRASPCWRRRTLCVCGGKLVVLWLGRGGKWYPTPPFWRHFAIAMFFRLAPGSARAGSMLVARSARTQQEVINSLSRKKKGYRISGTKPGHCPPRQPDNRREREGTGRPLGRKSTGCRAQASGHRLRGTLEPPSAMGVLAALQCLIGTGVNKIKCNKTKTFREAVRSVSTLLYKSVGGRYK